MSQLKSKLFTEIFKPNTLKGFVLPNRIKNQFENGLNSSALFYGKKGSGKSELAKFLAKSFNFFYLNVPRSGKMDSLKDGGELYNFLTEVQYVQEVERQDYKVVILDECNGFSPMAWESLKGIMQDFPNVLFIATTNHINLVPEEIISRFGGGICFNPESKEEETWLYEKYTLRIKKIIETCKFSITDSVLDTLIKSNFPDFRKILIILQRFAYAKITNITEDLVKQSSFEFIELYKLIISGDIQKPEKIHELLMGDYANKAIDVVESLDNEFIKYLVQNHPNYSFGIPSILIKVSYYTSILYSGKDQALPMKACVFELITIFNKIKIAVNEKK